MRMTTRGFCRLLAIASAVGLLAGMPDGARASFYAYSVLQTTNYTFGGVAVGTPTPLTSSSSAQIGSPSGSQGFPGAFDALESYVGNNPRPPENQFTPAVGQVNPDYARGDVLLGPVSAPGTNTVAEAFMNGPGNSAASGSWAIVAPLVIPTGGGVNTVAFDFTSQLTVVNSGPFQGSVAADFSYTFTVRDIMGNVVFTVSPDAVDNNASLSEPGSSTTPGSGSVSFSTPMLAAGTYFVTLAGSSNVFISAVPEPNSIALVGIGLVGLLGYRWRRQFQARVGA